MKKEIHAIKKQQIPKLNVAIKDEQMSKDKLAVQIVEQKKKITRQKHEIARLVCESNAFYVRA